MCFIAYQIALYCTTRKTLPDYWPKLTGVEIEQLSLRCSVVFPNNPCDKELLQRQMLDIAFVKLRRHLADLPRKAMFEMLRENGMDASDDWRPYRLSQHCTDGIVFGCAAPCPMCGKQALSANPYAGVVYCDGASDAPCSYVARIASGSRKAFWSVPKSCQVKSGGLRKQDTLFTSIDPSWAYRSMTKPTLVFLCKPRINTLTPFKDHIESNCDSSAYPFTCHRADTGIYSQRESKIRSHSDAGDISSTENTTPSQPPVLDGFIKEVDTFLAGVHTSPPNSGSFAESISNAPGADFMNVPIANLNECAADMKSGIHHHGGDPGPSTDTMLFTMPYHTDGEVANRSQHVSQTEKTQAYNVNEPPHQYQTTLQYHLAQQQPQQQSSKPHQTKPYTLPQQQQQQTTTALNIPNVSDYLRGMRFFLTGRFTGGRPELISRITCHGGAVVGAVEGCTHIIVSPSAALRPRPNTQIQELIQAGVEIPVVSPVYVDEVLKEAVFFQCTGDVGIKLNTPRGLSLSKLLLFGSSVHGDNKLGTFAVGGGIATDAGCTGSGSGPVVRSIASVDVSSVDCTSASSIAKRGRFETDQEVQES